MYTTQKTGAKSTINGNVQMITRGPSLIRLDMQPSLPKPHVIVLVSVVIGVGNPTNKHDPSTVTQLSMFNKPDIK